MEPVRKIAHTPRYARFLLISFEHRLSLSFNSLVLHISPSKVIAEKYFYVLFGNADASENDINKSIRKIKTKTKTKEINKSPQK